MVWPFLGVFWVPRVPLDSYPPILPRKDDATRRGFVNVSFGHLTIAATVEQPLGHSLFRAGMVGCCKIVCGDGNLEYDHILYHKCRL